MKILLVEDDDDFRSMLARILVAKTQAEIVEAGSGNKAVAALKANTSFDLVVSDYNMKDGNGGEILKYLASVKSTVPFILCSSIHVKEIPENAVYPIAESVLKPNVLTSLIEVIEKYQASREVMDTGLVQVFFQVDINAIPKISPLSCPFYIQLSEKKYVRVLNKGDIFSEGEMKRFKDEKKQDFLYIRVEDCEPLVSDLAKNSVNLAEITPQLNSPEGIQQLADLVKDKKVKEDISSIAMMLKVSQMTPPTTKQSVEPIVSLHSNATGHIKKLGFTPEVQALVNSSVSLMLSVISASDPLADALKKFYVQPGQYLGGHSVYLAHVACAIASLMSWGSAVTRHKLALAAFLHDIPLDDDRLARFESLRFLEEGTEAFLTEKEKETVKKHPEKAVQMIRGSENILAHNIEDILLQHHERPDGTGYPNQFKAAKIDPLASTFIVAHDLVEFILSSEMEGYKIADFLKFYEKEYSSGYFKKIATAMRENMI